MGTTACNRIRVCQPIFRYNLSLSDAFMHEQMRKHSETLCGVRRRSTLWLFGLLLFTFGAANYILHHTPRRLYKTITKDIEGFYELSSTRKVALLFLTVGPLPHAHLWEQWLAGAAALLPLEDAVDACAHGTPGEAMLGRLATKMLKGSTITSRQSLYSIYVHAPPSFTGT